MTRTSALIAILLLVVALDACRKPANDAEVVVFAAASLEDALRELAPVYERKSGERLTMNFAASNVLAQQIAATRGADLFVSADERWMDWLAERSLIDAASRRPLLGNSLVVAARNDTAVEISELSELATADYDRLVIAEPEAVPLGRYARALLTRAQHSGRPVWDSVRPRLAPALDARAVVASIESDPRRIGIVYGSDLSRARRLRALLRIPAENGPRILYPAALVAGRPEPNRGRALLEFLESDEAREVFRRFGFTVPGSK
jgi:molybdate transport system substrate-binding protein